MNNNNNNHTEVEAHFYLSQLAIFRDEQCIVSLLSNYDLCKGVTNIS